MVTLSDGLTYSRLMQKELPFRILLPDGYGEANRRFPVLYLLHGLFGDYTNWTELTALRDYAAEHKLVIVMPQGADGWYVDSARIARNRFESHFINEFIPEVEDLFQLQTSPGSRAVAGLSMGGYGALKFALKYPGLFAFAGSISGAFSAPGQSDENPGFDWPTLKPSITEAFGEAGSRTRRANDLFELIRSGTLPQYPTIYIDCGESDGFLPVNRDFHDLLRKREIPHEFVVAAGGHDWEYWDRRIRQVLKQVSRTLI